MGPSWGMLGIISILGLSAVILGLMGYGPVGIPFSSSTRITGVAGKIVGALCIQLGILLLWFAGRVFGPRPSDVPAYNLVQAFPIGVAIYALFRIAWLVFGSDRTKRPRSKRTPRRASCGRDEDGLIRCPHCGKRMIDTAPDRCRYCGEELPRV